MVVCLSKKDAALSKARIRCSLDVTYKNSEKPSALSYTYLFGDDIDQHLIKARISSVKIIGPASRGYGGLSSKVMETWLGSDHYLFLMLLIF